ncbi:MAG: hypothetical protein WC444_00185 [Candidatus Paceibacterota bacterium]
MEKVWISGLFIVAIVAVVLFLVMRSRHLSVQEQGFVVYVQAVAKKQGLDKARLQKLLFEEWDKLLFTYGVRAGPFSLGNVPLVKKTIVETYE